MIRILFETHSTSTDNETRRASGWHDPPLSALGQRQALALFERRKGEPIAAVYCSDLVRSYGSAAAFGEAGIPVIRDRRLRECDYGDMNGMDAAVIEAERPGRIRRAFPGGESYAGCAGRVKAFLYDVAERHHDGELILIVAHRAVWYALEHHLGGRPLRECVTGPWQWRPGWEYMLVLQRFQ